MTDAEYRALAERLAELGEHAKRLHDQAYDTDLPENGDLSAASSAILALLEERNAAYEETQVIRKAADWHKSQECMRLQNEIVARATLAESRLEKAVEALREIARQKLDAELDYDDYEEPSWLDGYEECIKSARSVLSDLEKSE